MVIFDYHDYKKYVNDWIGIQQHGGHGQLRQIALFLEINSVVMSQVFRGDRDLTLEQALGVSKYIGLSELERDFFLTLVQKEKAGTFELKKVFDDQLNNLRTTAQTLKNRIKHQKFTDEDKATFYSQWYYSAIRLGVSIPEYSSAHSIANHLKLDRVLVTKVIEFLIRHKLVINEGRKLNIGPQVTHVGHDSPFVNRHHANWRLKGLQAMDNVKESDLFYTGPMAISKVVAKDIRKHLVELVENSTEKAAASNSESLHCLNIDWFSIE
jgi:uncharacterized protein (TIGR02147 family)